MVCMKALPPPESTEADFKPIPPENSTIIRVSSAKMVSAGSRGSLGKILRIGPSRIPINIRNMKMGMPVFLNRNSPANPTTIIPATTPKVINESTVLFFASVQCRVFQSCVCFWLLELV